MFRVAKMQQSLEELLIQTRLISSPQLAVAQRDAEIRNQPLAQTLIDLGFVNDRKFAEWLAGVTNLPVVDPLRHEVVTEFEANIPAEIAREHSVVPLDVNADEMTVATVNPLDRACIEAVRSATGMKIQPVIAIHGQMVEMLNRVYPKPRAFDPSATIAVSDTAPFEYGDETMLRMHSRQFAFDSTNPDKSDDSLGSETRILPPPASEPQPAGEAPDLGGAPPPSAAPASTSFASASPASPSATSPSTVSASNTAPSSASHPSPTQLDRIERHLADLMHAVETLQRRIEAIDSTLARIVNR